MMIAKIFDTHAHYDDRAFDVDREKLLRELPKQGIGRVLNCGANMESSRNSVTLAEKYDYIYAAGGVHPSDTAGMTEEDFTELKSLCNHPKVKALGEIGLDYYWKEPEATIQKLWLERQLNLAMEVNLPIIVHSRDAAKDTYDILKSVYRSENPGIIHCFSYSKEMARQFLDLGFSVGIGGVVTFQNAKAVKEVAEYVPLDRLVIETDCPYLAPTPNRGKRNSSLNLPYVISAISELRGISEEELVRATWENGNRIYQIEE